MKHSDIINLWPTMAEMARDLGLAGKNAGQTVYRWRQRDSIPQQYWLGVVEAAKNRDLDVSLEVLAQAAAKAAA